MNSPYKSSSEESFFNVNSDFEGESSQEGSFASGSSTPHSPTSKSSVRSGSKEFGRPRSLVVVGGGQSSSSSSLEPQNPVLEPNDQNSKTAPLLKPVKVSEGPIKEKKSLSCICKPALTCLAFVFACFVKKNPT